MHIESRDFEIIQRWEGGAEGGRCIARCKAAKCMQIIHGDFDHGEGRGGGAKIESSLRELDSNL